MSNLTSQCLAAAGFTKIVWIDDYFASPSREELALAIQKHLEILRQQKHPKIEFAPFAAIDLTKSKTEVEDACEDIIDGMSDNQLLTAAEQLGTLAGSPKSDAPQPDDLLPQEFEALKTALGTGLRTFSMTKWTSSGALEFSAAGEDTLFLIDKEFNRELGGIDGTKLLADLVKQSFCILLTHTCTVDEQEQRRVAIATSEKLPAHRFCILSKQQSRNLEMDRRFAVAIRAAMTHKFCGEIADVISKRIQRSAAETAQALTKQAFADLEQALFENSHSEGVLEYDVMVRVFHIEQRHALNELLQDDTIQNQLRASRNFREKIVPLNIPSVEADMTFFRNLRQREVFFEGAGLNKLHAALACGDVFDADGGKRYLLLAQPCDLMVRKNGERRAEVCLLVSIGDLPEISGARPFPDYRFYELKGVFGNDKKLVIDFTKLFVADLSVLDFAVFNPDGRVQLHRNQPVPSTVLTAGWSQRMARAKCRIFPKGKVSEKPLGMGKQAARFAGVVEGDLLRYPLQRIGRFESATATAILAAWATFQTRAALDHDFAQTEPKSSTVPEGTGGIILAESTVTRETSVSQPVSREIPLGELMEALGERNQIPPEPQP